MSHPPHLVPWETMFFAVLATMTATGSVWAFHDALAALPEHVARDLSAGLVLLVSSAVLAFIGLLSHYDHKTK